MIGPFLALLRRDGSRPTGLDLGVFWLAFVGTVFGLTVLGARIAQATSSDKSSTYFWASNVLLLIVCVLAAVGLYVLVRRGVRDTRAFVGAGLLALLTKGGIVISLMFLAAGLFSYLARRRSRSDEVPT